MKVLLLAAGLGTRLRPLTDRLPKCLVPIHGIPLLEYWLRALLQYDDCDVLINTHYLAPLVVEYVRKSQWAHKVTLVYEENLLGTGGTILKNREFFQEESFLVAHADNLTVFNIGDFIKHHTERPHGAELTMMLFKTNNPRSCGIVELNSAGMVTGFHEKVDLPPGDLANAAVYVVEPTVIDLIASYKKKYVDFSVEIIPKLIPNIFTYKNTWYHRDIGTIDSWKEAHKDFKWAHSI